jgi:hypothetical protein
VLQQQARHRSLPIGQQTRGARTQTLFRATHGSVTTSSVLRTRCTPPRHGHLGLSRGHIRGAQSLSSGGVLWARALHTTQLAHSVLCHSACACYVTVQGHLCEHTQGACLPSFRITVRVCRAMARVESTLDMIEQLRGVFKHRCASHSSICKRLRTFP